MPSRKQTVQVYPIQGLEWREIRDEGLDAQAIVVASKKGGKGQSGSSRSSSGYSQSLVSLEDVTDFIVQKAAIGGGDKWGIKASGVTQSGARSFLNFTGPGVNVVDNVGADELTIDITGGGGGTGDVESWGPIGSPRIGVVNPIDADYPANWITYNPVANPNTTANRVQEAIDDMGTAINAIVPGDGSLSDHSDVSYGGLQNNRVLTWNGSNWQPLDVPYPIVSFNTRTGAVVPAAGDYTAVQVNYTPADTSWTVTQVKAALDDVKSQVDSVITGVRFLGIFDPTDPTPPNPQDNDGVSNPGDFYVVDFAGGGSQFWDFANGTPSAGPAAGRVLELFIGDRPFYDDSNLWANVRASDLVTTVFGRPGPVINAADSDYDADQIFFDDTLSTPALPARVQTAIDALNVRVALNDAKQSAAGSVGVHSDVNITGITDGQILKWDSGSFIAADDEGNESDGTLYEIQVADGSGGFRGSNSLYNFVAHSLILGRSSAGASRTIEAQGTAADVTLNLQSKGNGNIRADAGTQFVQISPLGNVTIGTAGISWSFQSSSIVMSGTPGDIPIRLTPKGSGNVIANSQTLQIGDGFANSDVFIEAGGNPSDVSLNLRGKGAGTVNMITNAAQYQYQPDNMLMLESHIVMQEITAPTDNAGSDLGRLYHDENDGHIWWRTPDGDTFDLTQGEAGGGDPFSEDRYMFESNLDNVRIGYYFDVLELLDAIRFDVSILSGVAVETSKDQITWTAPTNDIAVLNATIASDYPNEHWYMRFTAVYQAGQVGTTGVQIRFTRP